MSEAVLVVDDSLTVRRDLAEGLEAAGFRVLECATLAAARLELAREPVALAILDVLLPDGDGLQLLQEIRSTQATAQIPILLLSTEAEVHDRVRGLTSGADDYVGKPYDRNSLVARARDLIHRCSESPLDDGVLVIDDSPTFREELRRALEEGGYRVRTAADGQEGLRLACANRPTAVIVDGVMPGIDGATVIRRIRLDAALRGTPCLLLTASDDGEAELRALDAGADAFVRKDEPLEIVLARLGAVMRSARASAGESNSLLAAKRVLAVDDSATYLHELSASLTGEGYDVVMARSGEEALEMLALQPVDCILLDLMMPGLGGRETCKVIKASPGLRDIPLIMLTALDDRSALVDGLTAGADDFISKGSDFDVLNARVRAQIRRKQFEDEHRKTREELRRSEMAASEERAARKLAETKAASAEALEGKNRELEVLAGDLERKNKELEAFSYTVSHDLRAPLRHIDGFSKELMDHSAAGLNEQARHCLERIRAAAQRMGELIHDILELSRLSQRELSPDEANLSEIANSVAEQLQAGEPERRVGFVIAENLLARADARLVRVLFENLFGNAWKFTARSAEARIEFGAEPSGSELVYFVRDNGAGFDMSYSAKLFQPFQRLHGSEFPGTGIGLTTVHRIIDRHRGRVWAEGAVNQGATIFFTLPSLFVASKRP